MTAKLVTVFGANGFLGRHVMRELVRAGWRIRVAVRRPHTAQDLVVNGAVGQIQLVQANLRHKKSVENAVSGANAIINLAGISYKKGSQTFTAVHELGVRNIAGAAKQNGITNIVQMSTIGANAHALSDFAKSKAAGERALLALVPSADIMRTTAVYGNGKGIFTKIAKAAKFSLILPLFGGGDTRLQPAYVADVAKAVSMAITRGSKGAIYELGGPQSYSFKELMQYTLDTLGKRRALIPVPWFIGKIIGFKWELLGAIPVLNLLTKPFITRDMVKGWQTDEVLSGDLPGFSEFGITPRPVEAIVPATLITYKKYGQFHQSA